MIFVQCQVERILMRIDILYRNLNKYLQLMIAIRRYKKKNSKTF
jgi:hypothetical protein